MTPDFITVLETLRSFIEAGYENNRYKSLMLTELERVELWETRATKTE